MLSLIAMAFLWTGSQIPVYIFGRLRGRALGHALANTESRRHSSIHLVINCSSNQKFDALPNPSCSSDIGGTDRWIWFVLANLLALAGVCPFVGSLSDLLGRRYVALIGSALVMIGVIVCSTAKSMNPFIGTDHEY